ncbi:MAG: adenylate/guanylate cyclase domain-containing protein, partial [Verrucomicrobiales bacterium]|nr:adenylate/guanylate cyclase domain-containing protein [Verrucomicrobiales bacterium]
FSEELDAPKLVQLLNEYLGPLTDILTYNGGTLDKYIGDAVVAMFGAPLPYEDHALRACLTAIEMQKKQAELREKWKKDGDWPKVVPRMQTRIGLNTGEAVIGNMGSPRRFNYTMMGDSVNLAARCESGAKSFGVYTMVTEMTHDHARKTSPDQIAFRFLQKLIVKGRSEPAGMYEIVGLKSELPQETADCLGLFEAGMEKYLARDFDAARAKFQQSAEREAFQPGDSSLDIETNPSLVMIERCREMAIAPPAEDWDGVYVMKTK